MVKQDFYKGSSTSKKLFDLVLRFKAVKLKYGCKILVTHVAGTRMIQQGTNGILRRRLDQGVSVRENMLSHCPWGKDALTAAPKCLRK